MLLQAMPARYPLHRRRLETKKLYLLLEVLKPQMFLMKKSARPQ